MKIRRRPISDSFSIGLLKNALKDNPDDANKIELLNYYKNYYEQRHMREENPEWQKNNLEYDLRTTQWVAEKCADYLYAQKLYAAMCNNEFTKNDIWPILKDERWSCSWRHAGGILADIREQGDYMDFYCSGIGVWDDSDGKTAVPEGVVDDEVKQDLLRLGWLVVSE